MREQVRELREAGWRRFKIPIALPLRRTARDRLLAAREAAGEDGWVGMDAAWVFRKVDDAVAFLDSVREASLGWFEDVFPPGDARIVGRSARALRRDAGSRWATSRAAATTRRRCCSIKAVDVVRIDLTCMGGITRAQPMIEACQAADTEFSPHMFAHVHSQVFGALGYTDVPIEWGVPGTGVDQFADSLRRPVLREGRMDPLPEEPGFGPLVNAPWIASEDVDDPDGLVRSLTRCRSQPRLRSGRIRVDGDRTVHAQRLAGDVARRRRGEEQDRRGDLLGLRVAAQRDPVRAGLRRPRG